MEFGYFTLSDNHYPNNPRSANQFITEIREQALLADKLGYHSAWIGEHHFDSLRLGLQEIRRAVRGGDRRHPQGLDQRGRMVP